MRTTILTEPAVEAAVRSLLAGSVPHPLVPQLKRTFALTAAQAVEAIQHTQAINSQPRRRTSNADAL